MMAHGQEQARYPGGWARFHRRPSPLALVVVCGGLVCMGSTAVVASRLAGGMGSTNAVTDYALWVAAPWGSVGLVAVVTAALACLGARWLTWSMLATLVAALAVVTGAAVGESHRRTDVGPQMLRVAQAFPAPAGAAAGRETSHRSTPSVERRWTVAADACDDTRRTALDWVDGRLLVNTAGGLCVLTGRRDGLTVELDVDGEDVVMRVSAR